MLGQRRQISPVSFSSSSLPSSSDITFACTYIHVLKKLKEREMGKIKIERGGERDTRYQNSARASFACGSSWSNNCGYIEISCCSPPLFPHIFSPLLSSPVLGDVIRHHLTSFDTFSFVLTYFSTMFCDHILDGVSVIPNPCRIVICQSHIRSDKKLKIKA